MKLRTYLVKRTIHMIITILIVLVLLFVLYRMMPGDQAASLMMDPKISQEARDQILVRYGFGRWVDYPGEYVRENYVPDMPGRYEVSVSALGDGGNSETLSTHFDINVPADDDWVPPRIYDVGILVPIEYTATSDPIATFYVDLDDLSGISQVSASILYPNGTQGDMLPMSHDFSFNRTVYTLEVELINDFNPIYIVNFSAEDTQARVATAALKFDASNPTDPENAKICNLSVDIPVSFIGDEEIYTYPLRGNDVSLTSEIMSANTPSFSVLLPNNQPASSPLMSDITAHADTTHFNGTFPATHNGLLRFTVEADGLSASVPFIVNSDEEMPFPADGPAGTYPRITGLELRIQQGATDREITASEYPLEWTINLKLRVNVTAVNSNGKRCSEVTATVVTPAGIERSMLLFHPNYVKMRTMPEQFVIYMKTMLLFDFGTSFKEQRPAWDLMIERIPSTALLFGTALVISYILGILIGVVVAWRRGSTLEMGTIVVTLFFYSMPIFWFALIMQWVFYAQLHWFPLGGMGGIELQGLAWFLDVLHHLVMPLTVLVILGLAGTILLMRSAMLEVIGEDFTTTAKAKGLKERTVVFKHVARNAMLPVVTSMAMSIGGIISGGVLTETIFSWYGMGTLLISATLQKDFPVVQGAFYILALLTILGNMAADILYAWLDPRVQL